MEHISNEEKAEQIAQYHCANKLSLIQAYNAALDVAEWKDEQHAKEKQQWIIKACDVYCKDCEYIGCDKFECLALEKFRKAMEEQL